MKSKSRIEFIFVGIAAMAFFIALVSVFFATRQLQSSDVAILQTNPFEEPVSNHASQTYFIGNNTHKSIGADANVNYETALKLIRGKGTQHDQAAAYEHLILAIQNDFPKRSEAAYELAKLYQQVPGDDCQRAALVWFKKSATWGYRKAHLVLGKSYLRGLGTEPDFNLAVDHYRIAAEMGSTAGAFALVELIRKGALNIDGDRKLARSTLQEFMPMLEREALSGNGHAARAVGRLYSSGKLLTQNLNQAEYWLERAVKAGDAIGMHDLAVLQLTQTSKDDNASSIVSLMRKSAELGYSSAMTTLGRLHLRGQYSLDKTDAPRWFNLGVDAGHAGSMEELARLYLEGDLVEEDFAKARKLAERGAALRHAGSIEILKKVTAASRQKLAVKE